MGEENTRAKSVEEVTLTPELIAELDGKYPNPTKRAGKVFAILRKTAPELTNWDLLCFASSYIGLIGEKYPWLLSEAKVINKLVHIAHYRYIFTGEEEIGQPTETTDDD